MEEGLTAGQAKLHRRGGKVRAKQGRQAQNLVVSEKVSLPGQVNPLLGHAVGAAQIALISQADSEVVVQAPEAIRQIGRRMRMMVGVVVVTMMMMMMMMVMGSGSGGAA